jgi:hypothetical protein
LYSEETHSEETCIRMRLMFGRILCRFAGVCKSKARGFDSCV